MTYIGIGYTGQTPRFLRDMVEEYADWLQGDRVPRFFGDQFVLLYDSNTAREFARKCLDRAGDGHGVTVYPVDRPVEEWP